MSYQPTQDLTWLYVDATGQLSIVATVTVTDLITNEHLNTSFGPISGGKCDIRLDVVAGVPNSPVSIPVFYVNIGAGLGTVAKVRAQIVNLNMITVLSTVYKDGSNKGEVSGSTTNTATIILN